MAQSDLAWESLVKFLQNNCYFVFYLHDHEIRRRCKPKSSFFILLKYHISSAGPIKCFLPWISPEIIYSTFIIILHNYISRFLWSAIFMNIFDSPNSSLILFDYEFWQNRLLKHCLKSRKNILIINYFYWFNYIKKEYDEFYGIPKIWRCSMVVLTI